MTRLLCAAGILLWLAAAVPARAQDPLLATTASDVAQATDFSIPVSPAFALLDVNPAKVHTPGFPRDFRIDWITREGRLVSDLALEVAPVWLLFFQDETTGAFQARSPILQTLSTLNLSVGTAQKDDAFFLAASAKLSLFRAADPMTDGRYARDLTRALRFAPDERGLADSLSLVVVRALDDAALDDAQQSAVSHLVDAALRPPFDPDSVAAYTALPPEHRAALGPYLERIHAFRAALVSFDEATNQRIRALRRQYERNQWNSARLDLGAGYVWTYDSPDLDSLALQDAGFGVWINGATGLGTERWLLSGLGRLLDDAGASTYLLGGNLRYGFNDVNLFVEYVFERLAEAETHTLSYGGAFALSPNFTIEFGLRTPLESEFEVSRLLPVVKVNGHAINDLVSPLAARL